MPPRYAYWTILIDNKPTAFRAQKQEELLPTFKQLSRTNPNLVMKWFARGRLWESPEQARWAQQHAPKRREQRGPDWRPGGDNRDPRARFKPKARTPGRTGPGAVMRETPGDRPTSQSRHDRSGSRPPSHAPRRAPRHSDGRPPRRR